jgi:hypothetical protein
MGKALQSIALFLIIGSLASASATASSLRDWEVTIDEGDGDEGAPRSLIDESNQPFEDAEARDSNQENEAIEVALPAKRQNFAARTRKDLALVPLHGKTPSGIKDETAITGENAKRRLPSYVVHNQPSQPSILHDIRQVTTSLLPMDFQGNAD